MISAVCGRAAGKRTARSPTVLVATAATAGARFPRLTVRDEDPNFAVARFTGRSGNWSVFQHGCYNL